MHSHFLTLTACRLTLFSLSFHKRLPPTLFSPKALNYLDYSKQGVAACQIQRVYVNSTVFSALLSVSALFILVMLEIMN